MTHIVLLGDSVFDNAAYVSRGEAVIDHLRSQLADSRRATLAARDGAVIADVGGQVARLPADASHLLISAGGNDALGASTVLLAQISSVGEAMARLATIRDAFAEDYATMLDTVLGHGLPTAICTIYDARFPDPAQRRVANTALCVLNDVITRAAALRGLPLVDLRVLLDSDADFANAIEPSGPGGYKLARTVVDLVTRHDFGGQHAAIFAHAREA